MLFKRNRMPRIKKILCFFSFFIITSSINCQIVDTTIYYPNGEYYTKGKYDKSKKRRIGLWQLYDLSHNLELNFQMTKWRNFKATKIFKDSSYSLNFYGFFRNDTIVLNGSYEFIAGNKLTKGNYLDGEKHGVWKYYSNDKLEMLVEHNIIYETHLDGNNKKVEKIKIPSPNTFHMFFDDNEKPSKYYMFNEQGMLDGIHIDFDKKGGVNEIGFYKNGLRDGEWSYYKDGKLIKRGNHYPEHLFLMQSKDSITILVNKDSIPAEKIYNQKIINLISREKNILPYFFKDGTWFYYYEDGSISKIEYYKKGELLKVRNYKEGKKYNK